jgi:hypothetical protein
LIIFCFVLAASFLVVTFITRARLRQKIIDERKTAETRVERNTGKNS